MTGFEKYSQYEKEKEELLESCPSQFTEKLVKFLMKTDELIEEGYLE